MSDKPSLDPRVATSFWQEAINRCVEIIDGITRAYDADATTALAMLRSAIVLAKVTDSSREQFLATANSLWDVIQTVEVDPEAVAPDPSEAN